MRAITDQDAEALFFLRSDDQMLRYLDRDPARSVDDMLPFVLKITESIRNDEGIGWGLSHKGGSGELIGTIEFWRLHKEHYRAELGYALNRNYWGQGLMTEAIGEVLRYGFDLMGLHSVEANVNPKNAPSVRLLEGAGFVKEAHFRESIFYRGQFLDSAVYSKLQDSSQKP